MQLWSHGKRQQGGSWSGGYNNIIMVDWLCNKCNLQQGDIWIQFLHTFRLGWSQIPRYYLMSNEISNVKHETHAIPCFRRKVFSDLGIKSRVQDQVRWPLCWRMVTPWHLLLLSWDLKGRHHQMFQSCQVLPGMTAPPQHLMVSGSYNSILSTSKRAVIDKSSETSIDHFLVL